MEITLSADSRQGTGKGVARKLRAAGKVPGVVYGKGGTSTPVSVDRRELTHAFATAGANVLFGLQVDGQMLLTMAREVQRNPLRGDIEHVDFLQVDRNQAIELDVPIHIVGDAPGVREGGVVEHHLWSVRVATTPTNVPEFLEADVSSLNLHDHLKAGDLRLPSGMTLVTDADEIVLTVATPQVLKVEAELEQPEMAAEAAEGEAAPAGEAAEPSAEG